MPKKRFIIFISIVLTVYAGINFYIFVHGWQALPAFLVLRIPYAAIYIVLAVSFIAGRLLERRSITWFSTVVVWIGGIWLGAMVYFLLAVVLVDIFCGIGAITPLSHVLFGVQNAVTPFGVLLIIVGIVTLIVLGGFINARTIRINTLDLHVGKSLPNRKTFTIAMASDIHLGTIIGAARLKNLVAKINALDADLILLPGDVFDEDIGPVIKNNLGETLRKLRARFGVYAITGNHEYIGGVEAACAYMGAHGIRVLRDECSVIDDTIQLIGREDRSSTGFAGKKRATLEELSAHLDHSKPVIMMDHQPFHLEEAVRNGVDLQLSGHTHHGQLWPFNFITKKIYEVSWGYKKKDQTHVYVSCGAGTWGPPIRTGNSPEVVFIRLAFA